LKRFFAIILLSVHLFNLGGYALLFQYYIQKSDTQMVKQIFDNKIDSNKFIEIKIPVHFPTMQIMDDYVVLEGQIQLKDVFYNYVKMKMTRDTMYFVCIPNTSKTRLVNANIITAKEINDIPLSKKGHHDPLAKRINTLSEYHLQAFLYSYAEFETLLKQIRRSEPYHLNHPFINSPGKPPNFIS